MTGLRGLRDRIRGSWFGLILSEMDTEPVELAGGCIKVGIGAWLLLPMETFAASPTFETLAVLPEWTWGAFLLAVGVGHLAALRTGDVARRRWAASIGFVVWFTFAAVFLWSNPPAFGWVLFAAAAAGQLWASLRLSGVRA